MSTVWAIFMAVTVVVLLVMLIVARRQSDKRNEQLQRLQYDLSSLEDKRIADIDRELWIAWNGAKAVVHGGKSYVRFSPQASRVQQAMDSLLGTYEIAYFSKFRNWMECFAQSHAALCDANEANMGSARILADIALQGMRLHSKSSNEQRAMDGAINVSLQNLQKHPTISKVEVA